MFKDDSSFYRHSRSLFGTEPTTPYGLYLASEKTLLMNIATGADEFYTEDPGTNYRQARYLCYYLQEKGLLLQFYRKIYKNLINDPTGYETLKNVLGVSDMDKFKKDGEKFVLELTFP